MFWLFRPQDYHIMPPRKSKRVAKKAIAGPPEAEDHVEVQSAVVDQLDQGQGQVAQSTESDTQPQSEESHKRRKVSATLSAEEEGGMVEWLRQHPEMYDKRMAQYKDQHRKEFLWQQKTPEMGKNVTVLKVWYKSLRTRLGKLMKTKSGQAAEEMTDCNRWILTSLEFLRVHIEHVHRRPLVSVSRPCCLSPLFSLVKFTFKFLFEMLFECCIVIYHWLFPVYFQLREQCKAPEASCTTGQDDQSSAASDVALHVPRVDSPTDDRGPTPLSLKSRSSCKTASRGQRREADDELLGSLQDQGAHLVTMQQQFLEHFKPEGDQERLGFVEFVKSTLMSLDQYCWRRCQKDMVQLLMWYIEENKTLRMSQSALSTMTFATPKVPCVAPSVTGSFYPARGPVSSHGQSASPNMWQPPPSQWSTQVQNPTSVWGSMDARWAQQEYPQVNNLGLCTSQPGGTSSAESSLHLSGLSFIRDMDTDNVQAVDHGASDKPLETPELWVAGKDAENDSD